MPWYVCSRERTVAPEVFKLFKEINILKKEIAPEKQMELFQYLVYFHTAAQTSQIHNLMISNLNRNNLIHISKCGAGAQRAAAIECGVRNRFTTFIAIALYLFTCWSPSLWDRRLLQLPELPDWWYTERSKHCLPLLDDSTDSMTKLSAPKLFKVKVEACPASVGNSWHVVAPV